MMTRNELQAKFFDVATALIGLHAPDKAFLDVVAPYGDEAARKAFATPTDAHGNSPDGFIKNESASSCKNVALGILRLFLNRLSLPFPPLAKPFAITDWTETVEAAKALQAYRNPMSGAILGPGCIYHLESASGRHWRSIVDFEQGGFRTVDGGAKTAQGYQAIVEAHPKVQGVIDLTSSKHIIDWIDCIALAQALLAMQDVKPSSSPTPAIGATPTLRLGSRGDAVKRWQTAIGVSPVDGVFGSVTEIATRSWQKSHGLSPDGVVGPQSWKTIGSTPALRPITQGVDVSHWNRYTLKEWEAIAAAKCSWAIAKASERTEDDMFGSHVANARAAGIKKIGAYQYMQARAGAQTACIDAGLYMTLRAKHGATDLPPILDVERQGNEARSGVEIRAYIRQWLDTVKAIDRTPAVLYVEPAFWNSHPELTAWTALRDEGVGLWVAHWDVKEPMVPKPWDDWDVWQYHTSAGTIPGINGPLDLNVSRVW